MPMLETDRGIPHTPSDPTRDELRAERREELDRKLVREKATLLRLTEKLVGETQNYLESGEPVGAVGSVAIDVQIAAIECERIEREMREMR